MNSILITGASGLVGSNLVSHLHDGYKLYVVSRSKIQTLTGIENLVIDLNASFDYSQLPEKIDKVVYLAQSEYFRDFPDKAIDIFQVNTAGMLNMLEYARKAGAKSFIYASSGGVYGYGGESFSEDIDIPASSNLGFYLSTKLCSEILAGNYQQFMNIVLLRFFFVYGQGQKRSMLIPRLVDNIKNKRPVTLQGHNGISINPTHVSDVVQAITSAINLNESGKFNIAGPDTLSLRDICNIIGDRVNVEPIFVVDEAAKSNDLIGDINKMKESLWNPVVTFAQGIDSVL